MVYAIGISVLILAVVYLLLWAVVGIWRLIDRIRFASGNSKLLKGYRFIARLNFVLSFGIKGAWLK